MTDEVTAARVRIGHSLAFLNKAMETGDLKLGPVAQMVIEADALHSALALIYDALYDACARSGIIGRKPEHPITGEPEV